MTWEAKPLAWSMSIPASSLTRANFSRFRRVDCALVMRNIQHEWVSEDNLPASQAAWKETFITANGKSSDHRPPLHHRRISRRAKAVAEKRGRRTQRRSSRAIRVRGSHTCCRRPVGDRKNRGRWLSESFHGRHRKSRVESAFTVAIGPELTLAQVLIRRVGTGYELHHIDDRDVSADSLKELTLPEARVWAQFNAAGEFRPLKSAPDLRRGWSLFAASDAELETALTHLYPGAVADWFAARSANPPVTDYRAYTGRQSGMYRITTMLSDAQVAEVIHAVCDKSHCLKRRLWIVPGTPSDAPAAKSIIPCLEPCAVLMESARKALRATQHENSDKG